MIIKFREQRIQKLE